MANPTSGQFQTLVAAANIASQNLKFSNQMLRSVYLDYKPIAQTPGATVTLNVNIPTVSEGDTQDIGGGPLQPTDYAYTSTSIPFNHNDSTSFVVKNWDEIRTPADLSKMFIKPRLESLLRKINRRLANLVTATSFNSYAAITGAGTAKFSRADLGAAWALLANSGVNIEDPDNLFLVVTPTAYSNMMVDTTFYYENIVGVEASVQATQKAMIAPQFNASIRWDQQIPQATGPVEAGLFFHRNAIAMVTTPAIQANDPSVKETLLFPVEGVDLPVLLQMQYSIKDQGTLVNMICCHGETVVRPEHGVFMKAS
jgi:hypothetical protein